MEFKKLTKDLTVKQFEEIADNWLARLRRLQDFIYHNPTHPKAEKAITLSLIMANRMMIISGIYYQIKLKLDSVHKRDFKPGGVIANPPHINLDYDREMFIDRSGKNL